MTISKLYDPLQHARYELDQKAMLFSCRLQEGVVDVRLSPMHMGFMAVLFQHHPEPVPYKVLMGKVKHFERACPDVMRLHRKMSELRIILKEHHPELADIIHNLRGVGYSFPLSWRRLEDNEVKVILAGLAELVQASNRLVENATIVRQGDAYIHDRQPIQNELDRMMNRFNGLEEDLKKLVSANANDFNVIRLQQSLGALRTYVGLARMCDTRVSAQEWSTWHKQEVGEIFQELTQWLEKAQA